MQQSPELEYRPILSSEWVIWNPETKTGVISQKLFKEVTGQKLKDSFFIRSENTGLVSLWRRKHMYPLFWTYRYECRKNDNINPHLEEWKLIVQWT